MNNIERIELISTIARELQKRYTFSDIDNYLKGYKIKFITSPANHNSKWTYVKELLSTTEENILFEMANELDISIVDKYSSTNKLIIKPVFWENNHFQLFLSHLSSFKDNAENLRNSLLKYNISAFVAHKDIKPSTEWQNEIEKALLTADALVAILMPGFKESDWTDQEVGSAIGQDKLIIPIIKGLEPYGFIGKYQGLDSSNKTVQDVASGIRDIIVSHNKTKFNYFNTLITGILASNNTQIACDKVTLLTNSLSVPKEIIESLHKSVQHNEFFTKNEDLRTLLNTFFSNEGFSPIIDLDDISQFTNEDETIPF